MPDSSRWAFEPKLDGWRVLAYLDDSVHIRTRSGRAITDGVPELTPLGEAIGGHCAILDGELVAGQGRPDDFYRLAPRLAARRPAAVRHWLNRAPLTLAVFDVLHLDGRDLTTRSYAERRSQLESLALSGPAWCTVASYRSDGLGLLAACADLDMEGLVAKRLSSRYRPGQRSRDWIKVKTPAWLERHAPLRHETIG